MVELAEISTEQGQEQGWRAMTQVDGRGLDDSGCSKHNARDKILCFNSLLACALWSPHSSARTLLSLVAGPLARFAARRYRAGTEPWSLS